MSVSSNMLTNGMRKSAKSFSEKSDNTTLKDYAFNGGCGPLSMSAVESLRHKHGSNAIVTEKRIPWYTIFLSALFHPFNILLGVISLSTAVASELSTSLIIMLMIIVSTSLRFYQEWVNEGAVHEVLKLITKSVVVIRYNELDKKPREKEVFADELVPGDWVVLHPGEVVPADAIILTSKVFFVSQAALTGEALPIEKRKVDIQQKPSQDANIPQVEHANTTKVSTHKPMPSLQRFFRQIFGLKVSTEAQLDQDGFKLKEDLSLVDHIFMGSQVISGVATCVVLRTGPSTLFGKMAEALCKTRTVNSFQMGVRRISWLFFIAMAILVPSVFVVRVMLNGKWREAFIFSLSVAVGLTPEMLPMIVNANLAKGSLEMTKKQSITKRLDAIINLGAVDVLCMDKTGTLTKSVVQLSSHVDPYGNTSVIPLQMGFLNAYFQSFLQNPLDSAITAYHEKLRNTGEDDKDSVSTTSSFISRNSTKTTLVSDVKILVRRFSRLDELPFDFERRRLSVVLQETLGNVERTYLVCKGAVDETLNACTKVRREDASTNPTSIFCPDSETVGISDEFRQELMSSFDAFTKKGERVLAVAFKNIPPTTSFVTNADECDMIFVGFLSFVDAPKYTTDEAVARIRKHNVEIKVLTGDSASICASVCKSIKLPVNSIVTSEELDQAVLSGNIAQVVEAGTIFAKVTPLQKSLIVRTLREQNHVVGFIGDGINDAPALKEADVGISVENGVDICQESADIILLDKDLNVVVDGIRVGRITYGNTIKYIAMATSANFGNVVSVLIAAVWFPTFEPMLGIHLLVQNLLYDFSQISIPWDSVDEDFLLRPHKWKLASILRFMLWMAPWSSVFDLCTFAFMYFKYDIKNDSDPDKVKLFQTTWFTVGLLTQTLIVHIIRTDKVPIIHSRASCTVTTSTIILMGVGLILPYMALGYNSLGFHYGLPTDIYYFIVIVLAAYCVVATFAKFIYTSIFKEWF